MRRYRQVKINVIGRKSGKKISIPVWFVVEGEKLYLLARDRVHRIAGNLGTIVRSTEAAGISGIFVLDPASDQE